MTVSHNIEKQLALNTMGVAERKAREFERREEEILDASFDLFLKKGLNETTIDMIAEVVEIGKGTVYKHFKSKHEIYATLFLRHLGNIQKEIEGIDQSLPIIDQLRIVLRIGLKYWVRENENNKVFHDCLHHLTLENLSGKMLEKVTYHHDKYHDQYLQLLKKAKDEDILINVQPEYLFLVTEGLMAGVGKTLMSNHDAVDPEILYQVIEDLLMKGFLK